MVPEDVFRAETDRMARDIRETYTPMPGTDRSLLPGAIEEERFAHHRANGVRYGEMEQTAARDGKSHGLAYRCLGIDVVRRADRQLGIVNWLIG